MTSPHPLHIIVALTVAHLLCACDPPGASPTKPAASTVTAAPHGRDDAPVAATSIAAAAIAPVAVPVLPNSRVSKKVNAVFHYYDEQNLDALADAQKKLLISHEFTIDNEKEAAGYRSLTVSKGGARATVNVACVPAEHRCFISLPKPHAAAESL